MILEESIIIHASSERIFSYLMDINNRKDYIPALDEVLLIDPLPLKLGSRYIEVAEIAGRKLKTTYQIIRFIENERITAKTLKSIFPIQADLKLEPSTDQTTLTIELNFTLKGIFKMASPIVQGIVRKQANDILDKIKENIESIN